MDFLDNAICAMCSRGVHMEAGRIACNGCNLPTDCCLCPPVAAPAPAGPQR